MSGSWPNWQYYIHHSERIASLWQQDSATAKDLFQDLLGYDPYAKPIEAFRGAEVDFFSRLLTLKIWLDQRAGEKAGIDSKASSAFKER